LAEPSTTQFGQLELQMLDLHALLAQFDIFRLTGRMMLDDEALEPLYVVR
jgi:hypothetical protein